MPPLSRPKRKNVAKSNPKDTQPRIRYDPGRYNQHKNWFVKMEHIQGSAYLEKFYNKQKCCYFIEYYVTENEDKTHNLYGYFQLKSHFNSSNLINKFNCKTVLTPTTIAEKQQSDFQKVPDKIQLGEENVNVKKSLSAIQMNQQQSVLVPTIVKINATPTIKQSMFLPPSVKIFKKNKFFI